MGTTSPRVRKHRAGRRKQRKISVVVGGDCVGKSNKASRIVNFKNLIRVPITRLDTVHSTDLSVSLFNGQSVGPRVKRSAVDEYILSNGTDILCVTETCLRAAGDEVKCRDLAPPGFPPPPFLAPLQHAEAALPSLCLTDYYHTQPSPVSFLSAIPPSSLHICHCH